MDLGLSNQREASFKDGCLVIRQSVLEKQRSRCTPGPIYNPNLAASSKKSVRDITFGSGPDRFEDVHDGMPTSTMTRRGYCSGTVSSAIMVEGGRWMDEVTRTGLIY
mmetsp:Transcript_9270/g.19552  ORF Transcript_9270/g.19552 Transcript_9270/m.19552 type:complete len:107 (+) Transcript_9270:238-558(+)